MSYGMYDHDITVLDLPLMRYFVIPWASKALGFDHHSTGIIWQKIGNTTARNASTDEEIDIEIGWWINEVLKPPFTLLIFGKEEV